VQELNFQTISPSVVMNYSRTDFSTPPVARSGGSGVEEQVYLFADIFLYPKKRGLTRMVLSKPITGSNVSYRSASDILNPYWILNNSSILN
jgi:hypothetical protein